MKELVDFDSRDDFDRFMSQVENRYFENVAEVSKFPYSNGSLPEFPPKPFNYQDSKRGSSGGKAARNASGDSTGGQGPSPGKSYRNFDAYAETIKNLNTQRSANGHTKTQQRKQREQEKRDSLERQRLLSDPSYLTKMRQDEMS